MLKKTRVYFIIALFALIITGCGKDTTYQYNDTPVVNGVSAKVPVNIANATTPITKIANEVDYGEGLYLYKDDTTYMIFQMSSFVLAVQKDTNYQFSASDNIEESLVNSNFSEYIRIEPIKKKKFTGKPKKDGDVIRTEGKAAAQVYITDELYENFTGYFSNITDGINEWSIFVGSPTSSYGNLKKADKKMIEVVAKSLNYTGIVEELKTSPQESIVSIQGTSDQEVEEEIQPDNISSVMTRDIYHMASIGESVLAPVISYETSLLEEPIITLTKIYTDEEAQKIIDEYWKSDASKGEKPELPVGTKWQIAQYDIDYRNCNGKPYVNVKIKGVDGKNLAFRGIEYTKRTYDIKANVDIQDKVVKNNLCYYAVPIGCNEYTLEMGDFMEQNESMVSYYHIKI